MDDDLKNLKIEMIKIESEPHKWIEGPKQNLPKPRTPNEYRSDHMVEYIQPHCIGWVSMGVLLFLKGHKWDEVALGYVHSLRPSCIRVTTGCIKLDAREWRVTVYVDKEDIIEQIMQEVQVGLPEGVVHGAALQDALRYGIDSPQVKWSADAESYMHDGINGIAYAYINGDYVPFPKDEK